MEKQWLIIQYKSFLFTLSSNNQKCSYEKTKALNFRELSVSLTSSNIMEIL